MQNIELIVRTIWADHERERNQLLEQARRQPPAAKPAPPGRTLSAAISRLSRLRPGRVSPGSASASRAAGAGV